MRCVTCKSNNVKKISAVIAQGTKKVNLGHGILGIGVSKKSFGIAGAKGKSTGTIKDSLATKFEKYIPKTPSIFYSIFMFLMGIGILAGFDGRPKDFEYFFSVFAFVGMGYIAFHFRKKSFKKYEDAKDKFTRLWYCFKCNGVTIQGKLKKK